MSSKHTNKHTFDKALHVPYGQQPAIPFKDAQKITPDQIKNAWSLVAIAFVSGLVAWVAGLFIVLALRSLGVELKIGAAGLLGGGIMLFVLLLGLLKVFTDLRLITTIETITGHDLNQDGAIGIQSSTVVELHDARGSFKRWKLPFKPEVAQEWGKAAISGQSLAYKTWNPRFASLPDGSDGENNYRAFRTALGRAGLARDNGNHGISLTREGANLFLRWGDNAQDDLTTLLAHAGGDDRYPGSPTHTNTPKAEVLEGG